MMLTSVPHEISVRERAHGGGVLPAAAEHPQGLLRRRRELILLVHGFNVTVCDAGSAYDSFLANAVQPLIDRSVQVYWPGDVVSPFLGAFENGGIWTKLVSALHYPRQRQHAELSAQRLRTVIAQSLNGRDNVRLTIIAHSLGCRLVLELLLLLKGFWDANLISVPLVMLMAPAVPRYLVLPGGRLHDALPVADRIFVYRSLHDEVLKRVFRMGQALERPFPEGWSPVHRTALGRNGFGVSCPPNVTEVVAACGHGGYWPDPNIAYELGRVAFGPGRALLSRGRLALPVQGSSQTGQGRPLTVRTLKERSANSVFRRGCGGHARN